MPLPRNDCDATVDPRALQVARSDLALLIQRDKPEWSTGAKWSRFAYIAKDYSV